MYATRGRIYLGKISYTIDIGVPLDKCFSNFRRCLDDERYKDVCSELVSPKYIPVIIDETENQIITIKEISFDPLTGFTHKNISMIHNYIFISVTENITRINISTEYSILVALFGLGTVKGQVKDKIIGIVNSLLSYENGLKDASNV